HVEQADLQQWLQLEMPAAVVGAPTRVALTDDELAEIDRRDAEAPGMTVVGRTKRLGRRVDFGEIGASLESGVERPFAGGFVRGTDDGGFVWATALTSDGASALRVGFAGVRLPSSTDLYVHNLVGQAFGPYSRRDLTPAGELWSNSVLGDTVIVQLRQWGPATDAELGAISLSIEELGHIGPKFRPAVVAATREFCEQNASCVENTNCSGGPSWSAKADAEAATALMLWISGAFINTCTGGLVSDTDGSSQIPYVLTANHCVSKNADAANMEFYFQFEVACGGNCPNEWAGGGIQRLGSTLLATNRSGDYTLLQMSQSPPSGSSLMGWTTANVANADGTTLYRISHPATAPQAYSAQTVDTSAGTCRGVPRGDWIYSRDIYGATEGGSSGSPVYNGAGQIVGQLTGACGFSPGDPCASEDNATIDGAFANYFDAIDQYLDPSPCSPSPEDCDDGADNDCDGATDCSDADCSGDPACGSSGCVNPGGAPAGASCSSNADCCSNKCKGPPSNLTCR
ncbi:MAG TPA: serine protease, partial [Candidatus Polarisedimenticolaceae bacterium]|nr:serine protease [Candidatus Polarisedimenticolaceae bacterium]